jgi:magnesium-transporting ATPase (P-type)
MPFSWYSGLFLTAIRVAGGALSAYFRLLSDKSLYKISEINGFVKYVKISACSSPCCSNSCFLFYTRRVLRDGGWENISAIHIVPGDVVALERGPVFCDLVILKGDSIVVDESALTGEATPVSKRATSETGADVKYSLKRHASNSIWAGTEILDVQEGDVALVTATGSFTNKGGLLTEVLSCERHRPHFEDDVQLVVILLTIETALMVGLVFDWLDSEWVQAYFYGKLIVPCRLLFRIRLTLFVSDSYIRCVFYSTSLDSNDVCGCGRNCCEASAIETNFLYSTR